MCVSFQRKSRLPDCSGFSLIEIMVATVILIVIVLITSAIFHQSNVAWDGGMRKAEGGMMARAVLGLIARELSQAVGDLDILNTGEILSENWIRFVTLTGDNKTGERVARQIQYDLDNERLKRTESRYTQDYQLENTSVENTLVTNVYILKFIPLGNFAGGNMPKWVRIVLGVKRTDDVSGVGAWSYGPDGAEGIDDIRSW